MLLPIAPVRVENMIERSGAHGVGVRIMQRKGSILPLEAVGVRTPAVNILKQELLALGGECVVPAGAITCSEPSYNIIMLATRAQYHKLTKKLLMMPYFGLKELREELQAYLELAPLVTTLRDGRHVTYDELQVMGIINVTPDSFYEGSRHSQLEEIVATAKEMLEAGATILDIGGESTRPGSDSVGEAEEQARVVPAIRAIKEACPEAIISVDTFRSVTAEAALEAGADIINDITAGEADDAMLELAVRYQVPIILMHMRGTPKTMQADTHYEDVVREVASYLLIRAQLAEEKGLTKEQIILDPGIGFAKLREDNLRLMQGLEALTGHGYPVLLAASRKTVIGQTLGDLPPSERLEGTMATSCQAVYAGAQMVRVHDVKANTRVIRMLEAIRKCQ